MTNKERTELARLQKEYNELHERLGYSRNERTCRAINNRLDEICRKEVLERRKKELDRIYSEGKACKNGYRRQCLAQEYKRLKAEYDYIDGQF